MSFFHNLCRKFTVKEIHRCTFGQIQNADIPIYVDIFVFSSKKLIKHLVINILILLKDFVSWIMIYSLVLII